MYTTLYAIATIICFIVLIKDQPINHKSILYPNFLVLFLFSLVYLLPATIVVYGPIDYFQRIFDTDAVEAVSLYCLVFVLAFTGFNKALKERRNPRSYSKPFLSMDYQPKFIFNGWLFTFLVTKFIFVSYGVYDSDYTNSYLVQQSLPLALAQGLKVLGGVNSIFAYLLMVSYFTSSSSKLPLRFISILFITYFIDMWITNSRSNFVISCVIFMCGYVFYGRTIGLMKELAISCVAIPLFGLFTIKRYTGETAISFDLIDFLVPGEFINVYSNAVHLMSLSDSIRPPGSSYLQALISFVPSYIYPTKWDPASWYVGEYFPVDAAAGGGLAFGIVPEAIINWGLISIVFQAFVIVLIFKKAYSYAYYSKHAMAIVFYLFCCGSAYQLVRNGSFSIIGGLFFGFIVPSLIVVVIGNMLEMQRSAELRQRP